MLQGKNKTKSQNLWDENQAWEGNCQLPWTCSRQSTKAAPVQMRHEESKSCSRVTAELDLRRKRAANFAGHLVPPAREAEEPRKLQLFMDIAIPSTWQDFPGGTNGKASACNGRRPGLNPWVRKIPWRRKWQPTPVFLPGKSPWKEGPGRATVHGVAKKSDRTE